MGKSNSNRCCKPS